MKSKILIIGAILFNSIVLTNCNSNNSGSKINEPVKILTYSSAKEIIPGQWISTEKIYGDQYQYNLLQFNKDGTLKFAQGASSEQALKLANESTIIGKWTVNENPNLLEILKNDQRFLIEFDLESIGSEMLRVEIDPTQHRMGRIANENDALREQMGLFTFGGKIFYKQL
jgi:hypothetical protein